MPGAERGFCTYADEIDFHYLCEVDDLPERSKVRFYIQQGTGDGSGPFVGYGDPTLSVTSVLTDGKVYLDPEREEIRPGVYKIYGIITDHGGVPLGRGSSAAFELKDCQITGGGGGGVGIDPAPVSGVLQITAPAEGGVYYTGDSLNIQYSSSVESISDNIMIDFILREALHPYTEISRVVTIRPNGTINLSTTDVIPGRYYIDSIISERGVIGSSRGAGSSGVFRLERRGNTSTGGIEITSPTAADWYRNSTGPAEPIIVSYNLAGCEGALTHGIVISLFRFFEGAHRYELYRDIPEQISNTMSFSIPSGSLGPDPTGNSTVWLIEIKGDTGTTGDGCWSSSETFKISQ